MSRLLGENLKKSYIIFFYYLPLQIWTYHDILIITARSFKLGQVIEDDK